MTSRTVAVFDLGGVLVDWNPRYLYRKLFSGDDTAMEHFLANICTSSWNSEQDAGRTFAEGCAVLKLQHPGYANLIDAWFARHCEMVAGSIPGTVEILAELRARKIPLYALSNWSTETFPTAQKRFEFLRWFDGILLSGEAGMIKPDRRIYERFFETFSIDPSRAVFVDDLPPNAKTARELGMHAILFTDPAALRRKLADLGWLSSSVGRI
jgi:2-haloacid dehalogenase